MKPRLVSRPLTSEDVMIWRRWRRNVGDPWYGRLRIEYGAADIRDADLMLHAQTLRTAKPWPPLARYPGSIVICCVDVGGEWQL